MQAAASLGDLALLCHLTVPLVGQFCFKHRSVLDFGTAGCRGLAVTWGWWVYKGPWEAFEKLCSLSR